MSSRFWGGNILSLLGLKPTLHPTFKKKTKQKTVYWHNSVNTADSVELHINKCLKWLKKKAVWNSVYGVGKEGIGAILTAKFFCKLKLL